MSKLSEEELSEELAYAYGCSTISKQAYQQMEEMIKKLEITEEWYKERAEELIIKLDLIGCPISVRKAREFIRSFVEEIIKKERQRGV